MKNFVVLIAILYICLLCKSIGVDAEENWECDGDVADYVNQKINETLTEYKEKPSTKLMLTLIYNESYKRLADSVIQKPGKKSDCNKAEMALHRFLSVASHYDDIVLKMLSAMKDLDDLQNNSDYSMQVKFLAFNLQTQIHFCTSTIDAESVLREYGNLKKVVEATAKNNKKDEKEDKTEDETETEEEDEKDDEKDDEKQDEQQDEKQDEQQDEKQDEKQDEQQDEKQDEKQDEQQDEKQDDQQDEKENDE